MSFTKEMITAIEKHLSRENQTNDYNLPITELDDMKVSAVIQKRRSFGENGQAEKPRYFLEVLLNEIYPSYENDFEDEYSLYKSEDTMTLENALKFSVAFFENCVLDLTQGKLREPSDKLSEVHSKLAIIFRKNERLKVGYDECCVCKDTETNTKTMCGHPVCIRCISRLPRADEADDYDENDGLPFTRKCPMCREEFHQIH
jgi:hypothetical protein